MLIVRTKVPPCDCHGATEDNCEQIVAIDGADVLGYYGRGREEHSGENPPTEPVELVDELADNELVEV